MKFACITTKHHAPKIKKSMVELVKCKNANGSLNDFVLHWSFAPLASDTQRTHQSISYGALCMCIGHQMLAIASMQPCSSSRLFHFIFDSSFASYNSLEYMTKEIVWRNEIPNCFKQSFFFRCHSQNKSHMDTACVQNLAKHRRNTSLYI